MYKIQKRIVISAAHYLKLDYESKCTNMHGHNWIIDIYLKSKTLNSNGMIMDFSEIKRKIKDQLDHKVINDVINLNPTAENIAYWICNQLQPTCYKVVVEESPDNKASYEKDED
ncbi:MAG: 6-carboxytetrahydropterin synthase QueD [Succinivibrionaceae bacterium]